jgi:hypothetical protein
MCLRHLVTTYFSELPVEIFEPGRLEGSDRWENLSTRPPSRRARFDRVVVYHSRLERVSFCLGAFFSQYGHGLGVHHKLQVGDGVVHCEDVRGVNSRDRSGPPFSVGPRSSAWCV